MPWTRGFAEPSQQLQIGQSVHGCTVSRTHLCLLCRMPWPVAWCAASVRYRVRGRSNLAVHALDDAPSAAAHVSAATEYLSRPIARTPPTRLCHVCLRTTLAAATSAPGLGAPIARGGGGGRKKTSTRQAQQEPNGPAPAPAAAHARALRGMRVKACAYGGRRLPERSRARHTPSCAWLAPD